MKILMVAPVPFFVDRGTPMRILEEALALERKGCEVNIVTYHLGRNIGELDKHSRIGVYRVARLLFWYTKKEAGADWQKVVLDLLLIWKTAKIVFLKKPEIIHAHLHEGVLVGWIVKHLFFWRKIKLVADFHGELVSEMESHGYLNGGIIKNLFHFLENLIFRLGDATIVSSGELQNKIYANLRVSDVKVVLDGVDVNRYRNISVLKEKAETVFIYSGAFVDNKGIGFLLEAILQVVKKKTEGFKFILAGGPAENIAGFISENGLSERVEIISPLNYIDLPEVNKRGDVAIDPKFSNVGQASGKILQYMAAGLPVICFDRENNRRYLGEAGYYVGEFTAEGLAKAILYFLENKDKIGTMGAIALKRSEDFSWDIAADKIINVYKKD